MGPKFGSPFCGMFLGPLVKVLVLAAMLATLANPSLGISANSAKLCNGAGRSYKSFCRS